MCFSAARALAVSPCGTYLVVGTGERLTVRCLSTGAQMALLRRHYRDVTLVRFHADSAGFYRSVAYRPPAVTRPSMARGRIPNLT